jgi:hypothetical protein
MHINFWLETMMGRDYLEVIGIDGTIILERLLGKLSGKTWTGCTWLRRKTSSGLL